MTHKTDEAIARLMEDHAAIGPDIEARLRDFEMAWQEGTDRDGSAIFLSGFSVNQALFSFCYI